MKKTFLIALACLLLAVCSSQPAAAGTNEQIIQVQVAVQLLQDNMARMQQSMDERMGAMKDLMTQQTANVNKMGVTIQDLQKSLGSQTTDAATKVDQISGQVQALHDSVDELKTRLAKVSKQLDDMQSAQGNIGNPAQGAPASGTGTPVPARPVK